MGTWWHWIWSSLLVALAVIHTGLTMQAQPIHASIPNDVNPNATYIFYLHGMIVQRQGAYAISEQFGAYEYNNIVKAFADLGYQVISEVRPKNAEIGSYADKIASEIAQLLINGVPADNIIVVGASMGGYIAIEAAYKLKNRQLKYAVLGVCSDYAFNYFSNRNQDLCGNFLSIYETSDGPGSCSKLLDTPNCTGGFKEIALSMGNSHGFLYKPYPEWMEPLSAWIEQQ